MVECGACRKSFHTYCVKLPLHHEKEWVCEQCENEPWLHSVNHFDAESAARVNAASDARALDSLPVTPSESMTKKRPRERSDVDELKVQEPRRKKMKLKINSRSKQRSTSRAASSERCSSPVSLPARRKRKLDSASCSSSKRQRRLSSKNQSRARSTTTAARKQGGESAGSTVVRRRSARLAKKHKTISQAQSRSLRSRSTHSWTQSEAWAFREVAAGEQLDDICAVCQLPMVPCELIVKLNHCNHIFHEHCVKQQSEKCARNSKFRCSKCKKPMEFVAQKIMAFRMKGAGQLQAKTKWRHHPKVTWEDVDMQSDNISQTKVFEDYALKHMDKLRRMSINHPLLVVFLDKWCLQTQHIETSQEIQASKEAFRQLEAIELEVEKSAAEQTVEQTVQESEVGEECEQQQQQQQQQSETGRTEATRVAQSEEKVNAAMEVRVGGGDTDVKETVQKSEVGVECEQQQQQQQQTETRQTESSQAALIEKQDHAAGGSTMVPMNLRELASHRAAFYKALHVPKAK